MSKAATMLNMGDVMSCECVWCVWGLCSLLGVGSVGCGVCVVCRLVV